MRLNSQTPASHKDKQQEAKMQNAKHQDTKMHNPKKQEAKNPSTNQESRLNVELCGLPLDNPIIPASGTFGYGAEFKDIYDINALGTFSFKGTTLQERFGNETPRIAETPSGMLNSVGLQNPGVDKVCSEILPFMSTFFHKPVMANVCGFSVEEYGEVAHRFNDCEQVGWLEINISCPNVKHGGMGFGTDAKCASSVIAAVKERTTKPVIAKLSPNVTDVCEIARACVEAGADALSLINTLMGMRFDLRTRRPILANVTGGLSGPAVLPVALRMVHEVAEAVDVPIIGMGGVSSAEDVLEMMIAGATAVEVGAANLVNPRACLEIIQSLPAAMDKYGIEKLTDLYA